MDEVQVRRQFITDECWERTSSAWKALKPLKDFNALSVSDESSLECYERLKGLFNIPHDVIEQWIYAHYYNINAVNNYGWIDYSNAAFYKQNLSIETLRSNISIIAEYEPYVRSREQCKPFDKFMCTNVDKVHWRDKGTWRVPPIILDVESVGDAPEYSEISGSMQLIEGHSRLGYLLAMIRSGIEVGEEHEVFILRGIS